LKLHGLLNDKVRFEGRMIFFLCQYELHHMGAYKGVFLLWLHSYISLWM
jgi:hypothetical protein